MSKLKYKIISNQEQYDKYCNVYEELVLKGNASERDEIELLELLIENYNEKIMKEYTYELEPVELLESIIEEHKKSQSEFARMIGISPQLLNDILKYRREISKNLAFKLSEAFAMQVDAFMRPYKLRKVS